MFVFTFIWKNPKSNVIFVGIVALGRQWLWTRSLAENDGIGKAQAEEDDSSLINHLFNI